MNNERNYMYGYSLASSIVFSGAYFVSRSLWSYGVKGETGWGRASFSFFFKSEGPRAWRLCPQWVTRKRSCECWWCVWYRCFYTWNWICNRKILMCVLIVIHTSLSFLQEQAVIYYHCDHEDGKEEGVKQVGWRTSLTPFVYRKAINSIHAATIQ